MNPHSVPRANGPGASLRRRALRACGAVALLPALAPVSGQCAMPVTGAGQDDDTDRVIAAYNRALDLESRRLLATSQQRTGQPDAQRLLAFLTDFDARHQDIFATALKRAINQHDPGNGARVPSRATSLVHARAKFLALVQRRLSGRGMVMRFSLLRDRRYRESGLQCIWALGPVYQLDKSSRRAIQLLYGPQGLVVARVRTVLTDNPRANFFAGGRAYVAPESVHQMAQQVRLPASRVLELYALHEAAHKADLQAFGGSEELKQSVYSLNLNHFSELAGNVAFYEAVQIDEFVADAVMAQAGSDAVRLLAWRAWHAPHVVASLGQNKRPGYIDPHAASASFMLAALLRQCPDVRVGAALRHVLQDATAVAGRPVSHADKFSALIAGILNESAVRQIGAEYLAAARGILNVAHRR